MLQRSKNDSIRSALHWFELVYSIRYDIFDLQVANVRHFHAKSASLDVVPMEKQVHLAQTAKDAVKTVCSQSMDAARTALPYRNVKNILSDWNGNLHILIV
jgi:hypothetical protein